VKLRKGTDPDPVKGVGDLWKRQDEVTQEEDFTTYNTKAWIIAKLVMGTATLTLVYLLYALHELPWTIFGSAVGLLIMGGAPFLVGVVLGFSYENMWMALKTGVVMGFVSLLVFFIIITLPYLAGYADYTSAFMLDVWFYTFIAFIDMISFVPAGVALATATNMYD
jgi:hypothetical protein